MQVHHAGGKKDEDAGETLAPFSFSFLLLLLLLPCIVHVSMSHPGRQASSDDCISLLSRGASPASCLLMPRSWKAVAARMRGRGLGLRLVCWWWRRRPTPSNSRACGLSLTWRSVLRLRAGTSCTKGVKCQKWSSFTPFEDARCHRRVAQPKPLAARARTMGICGSKSPPAAGSLEVSPRPEGASP